MTATSSRAGVGAVVLGLAAPQGFARGDLTSPARAARAGALVDVGIDSTVTELRIHGVSGSSAATMLEHPASLQVAGDRTSGFHRRWTSAGPGGVSVPWRLEAYSWGGLTEARLASASWILLAPFMLYNVAHFMLPPGRQDTDEHLLDDTDRQKDERPGTHVVADSVLRLLALAATVQMIAAAVGALLDIVALQAGGMPARLPVVLRWFGAWPAGLRGTTALLLVLLAVALLWVISVRTGNRYEAWVATTGSPTGTTRRGATARWALADPRFWRGKKLVERQRTAHTAAALGAVTIVASMPGLPGPWHRSCLIAGAIVLLVAALLTVSPALDRYVVAHEETAADRSSGTGTVDGRPWLAQHADRTSWRFAFVAVAAVVTVATIVVDAASGTWAGRQAITGELASFWLVLIAAQVVLLGVFAVAVRALAPPRRDATESDLTAEPRDPYLGGQVSTVVVALAVVLGGLLSAVADIGIARTFGDPVPGAGAVGVTTVAVAWPLYAFAAAPVGFLVAAVAAGAWLARRYFRRSGSYAGQVAGAYGQPDDGCAENCRKIASTWALARVADDAGPVVAALTAGGAGAVVVAALASGGGSVAQGIVEGILSASTVAALVTAAGLVTLLRSAYADSDRRRAIGAVWDVGTFWPRAAHPLAPPCYAERAVPEVVDRIRVLTGHVPDDPNDTSRILVEAQLDARGSAPPELTVSTGPVLLTGYSQGSIIAPAVVAQLPPDVLPDTALLTLACPARRLYGRAFPAFFRPDHLEKLAELLTDDTTRRWTNVVRRSDYIGSWVGRSPTEPAPADPESLAGADVRCLDPVALVPDAHPAPPPIHRHSGWWSDPQIVEPAARLVGLLALPAPTTRPDR